MVKTLLNQSLQLSPEPTGELPARLPLSVRVHQGGNSTGGLRRGYHQVRIIIRYHIHWLIDT